MKAPLLIISIGISCFAYAQEVGSGSLMEKMASSFFRISESVEALPLNGKVQIVINSTQISDSLHSAMLFNGLSDTLHFTLHLGKLIGIQEAKDKKGNWKPIEYWFNDRCGNSFEEVALAPGTALPFTFRDYRGNFNTKLRLKLKVGKTILYSPEWDGSIVVKQFIKPKEMNEKNLRLFYSFLN